MELRTKVIALEGKNDLQIHRDFEISVEHLFMAYTEAEIISQWMGTNVLKLESKKHGSFQFETTDPENNKLKFNGVIHDLIQNEIIVRTFEFEGIGLGVQLETLKFIKLNNNSSKLEVHSLFQSVEKRNLQLKMPFEFGLSMAHNKLELIQKNKYGESK
ncbi:MAG: SRPBCC domain-containing protein [Leptospiraceae bacterium]|nr:SRPBCC domain-containing protein [Leptospiraceae bacterium]